MEKDRLVLFRFHLYLAEVVEQVGYKEIFKLLLLMYQTFDILPALKDGVLWHRANKNNKTPSITPGVLLLKI